MVMKTVGSTTIKATPTMKTVNRTAASSPMMRATIKEKRKTVMLKVINRTSGKPVKTI